MIYIIKVNFIGSLFLMILNYSSSLNIQPYFFIFGQAFAIIKNPFSIIICWLYFALMKSSRKQANIGKMIMGIKVTDHQDKKIGFGKSSSSYSGKIISFVIPGIGYTMAGLTQRKHALYDLSGNCLVMVK